MEYLLKWEFWVSVVVVSFVVHFLFTKFMPNLGGGS